MQSSLETLNIVEEKKQAEVGKDERVTPAEMNGKEPSPGHGPGEMRKVEPGTQKDSTSLSSESSSESEEEEDVGEYRPHHRVPEGTIREEQEECEEEVDQAPGQAAEVVERQDPVPAASVLTRAGASVGTVETVTQEKVAGPQIPAPKSVNEGAVKQDVGEDTEDDEQQKVNGEVAPVDIDVLPQIICCSEVNGRPQRELIARAVSQVEHTCLSSSPVLPGLLQLLRQDSDFDLSREEGGRPCFVDFSALSGHGFWRLYRKWITR